ncbi:uncharacterized protein K460DRAFT_357749 [Cucurbitaria berberidis CBS 394.84]|uniref:Uncharacterized protein n=1 Tax=Cucurbitaria berberidis CBS 394.84 TaxID=1168544 RepID=A0A9P4GF69_9PLEO|nr:uncharacterized protein K460DRAFT_357749 [Cucurbitaria berberidis CBS 394.84]KAF1844119.1 hypothetical protein K460DRAFT_357749 [Cucurbitaria berberidis CBS 394.84]
MAPKMTTESNEDDLAYGVPSYHCRWHDPTLWSSDDEAVVDSGSDQEQDDERYENKRPRKHILGKSSQYQPSLHTNKCMTEYIEETLKRPDGIDVDLSSMRKVPNGKSKAEFEKAYLIDGATEPVETEYMAALVSKGSAHWYKRNVYYHGPVANTEAAAYKGLLEALESISFANFRAADSRELVSF